MSITWMKHWFKDGKFDPHAKPRPMHVVQMIPFDSEERILMMHRSNNNRSARNVWSFPSGMHDIGETIRDCAVRELNEEYGLACQDMLHVGVYENIAGDADSEAQWHWVINLVAIKTPDVTKAINREPVKHDIMKTDLHLSDLLDAEGFVAKYPFHPSFEKFFATNGNALIKRLLQRVASCS